MNSTENVTELSNRFQGLLDDRTNVLGLLTLRDKLAKALSEQDEVTAAELSAIAGHDKALKGLVCRMNDHAALEDWRALIKPPQENWWWYWESVSNPFWNIAAFFLLTISVTLLADFTHRLFNSDPDEVGIAAVAIQALFTVAASSTFTATGTKAFAKTLRYFGVKAYLHPVWRFAATGLLLLVVFGAWEWGPGELAVHYNNRATQLEALHRDQEAETLYGRALALHSDIPQFHYNLGLFHEKSYRYEQATSEYELAIVTDYTHAVAYTSLARLLLLDHKPLNALRVADDGLQAAPQNTEFRTLASLYKNRAWAEYELGLYENAIADARYALHFVSNYAPSYCVLGKSFAKLDKVAEARAAWRTLGQLEKQNAGDPDAAAVEPDCVRLAENESDAKN